LVTPEAKAWSDGHYFHVITFGKGQMGSYASQLRPEQRWWVINYIRNRQGPATTVADSTSTASNAATGGNTMGTTGTATNTTK
jgi:hypothetical protein